LLAKKSGLKLPTIRRRPGSVKRGATTPKDHPSRRGIILIKLRSSLATIGGWGTLVTKVPRNRSPPYREGLVFLKEQDVNGKEQNEKD